MIYLGLVFAGLAALLHVFIFYLESIAWTSPRARATFGTGSVEQATVQKALAFNQGFYNLFLAIAAGLGIVAYVVGQPVIGLTLMFTGVGSMLAAATVLLLSSPDKASAAIKQGSAPLLAVVFLVLGLFL